jgi:hypothetical protein
MPRRRSSRPSPRNTPESIARRQWRLPARAASRRKAARRGNGGSNGGADPKNVFVLIGGGAPPASGLSDQRFGQNTRAPRMLWDIRIKPFFGCRH